MPDTEMPPMAATTTSADAPERYRRIVKRPDTLRIRPHLVDYGAACRSFRWEDARALLDGLPGGRGLNIAHEAVDRHGAGPRGVGPRSAGSAAPAGGC
jgi:acetyl-CoA synthetase